MYRTCICMVIHLHFEFMTWFHMKRWDVMWLCSCKNIYENVYYMFNFVVYTHLEFLTWWQPKSSIYVYKILFEQTLQNTPAIDIEQNPSNATKHSAAVSSLNNSFLTNGRACAIICCLPSAVALCPGIPRMVRHISTNGSLVPATPQAWQATPLWAGGWGRWKSVYRLDIVYKYTCTWLAMKSR